MCTVLIYLAERYHTLTEDESVPVPFLYNFSHIMYGLWLFVSSIVRVQTFQLFLWGWWVLVVHYVKFEEPAMLLVWRILVNNENIAGNWTGMLLTSQTPGNLKLMFALKRCFLSTQHVFAISSCLLIVISSSQCNNNGNVNNNRYSRGWAEIPRFIIDVQWFWKEGGSFNWRSYLPYCLPGRCLLEHNQC